MSKVMGIFNNIFSTYSTFDIGITTTLSVLLVVLLLSVYEFLIYRYVSHRSFYNKQFNILITILPFFISTIILCLQSNVVITLGTIGALAIIRFRTAVKDPIDMLYILWSVYIGIICGCQLYEVAVLTSIVVTVLLLVLENVKFGKSPCVVVIHCKDCEEKNITEILKKYAKKFKIKSRNYTTKGIDYAIEILLKEPDSLTKDLKEAKYIEKFSIIEYDSEDIV